MNRNTVLVKNTLIILFGKVCTQMISYLLLPVYTTVLSAAEYGTVDLLITYVALIAPIITLQMEAAVFRFLIDVRNDSEGIEKIITNSLTCVGGAIVIFGAICNLVNYWWQFEYGGLLIMCIVMNALLSIFLQIARGLGDNITYAIGGAISGIFTIVFNIVFIVIFPFGVFGMLSATALAQMLGIIYIVIRMKVFQYFKISEIDIMVIKEMSRYSMPLIPNSLSWWIISVSDRTVVSMFLGVQANGILSVATKFATIVVNVFSIFNLSWTESVAVHLHDKDGEQYISKISNRCFKLFATAGMVLILGCAVFFKYIIGSGFKSSYKLIPILVVGSILNVLQTLYGIIYIGFKNTKQASKSSFMAAILNISIDLFLIKFIGLYAAALSTVCAMLFLVIYRYRDINKMMKIRLEKKNMCIMILLYLIVCVVYYMEKPYLSIIGLVIILGFSIWWNRKMIMGVLLLKKNYK